jgi:hypothetical protein
VVSLLGLALVQLAGAVVRVALTSVGPREALRSPASAWYALGLAYAFSLGPAGLLVLAGLLGAVWALRGGERSQPRSFPWVWLAVLAALVLARPWVPTGWDEFVWLGKARLEAWGFGAGVAAAIDPAQRLIPPGYPPLWPATVGWLSLRTDALDAQVVAASLLVLLCAASAVEAWHERVGRPDLLALAVLATPLAWVHVRSTYVDLPVGLLGVALVGQLVKGAPAAVPMAVALVGFKDEGLAQVLAATVAALLVTKAPRWRVALPAVTAAAAALTWRWLTTSKGVQNADHALGLPLWSWAPTLVKLLVLHATDVFTWGVFWAVATACALRNLPEDPQGRAVRASLALGLLLSAGALLAGPERVRVFAENGTLINRLLMQLWPAAALAIVTRPGARAA